jgi:hypothetical protein
MPEDDEETEQARANESARRDRTEHLLDDVPQRLRVLAHAGVPRDDGHELRGFTKKFGRGQVHGIVRADGFERIQAANTSENRPVDVDHEAAPLESTQSPNADPFLRD